MEVVPEDNHNSLQPDFPCSMPQLLSDMRLNANGEQPQCSEPGSPSPSSFSPRTVATRTMSSPCGTDAPDQQLHNRPRNSTIHECSDASRPINASTLAAITDSSPSCNSCNLDISPNEALEKSPSTEDAIFVQADATREASGASASGAPPHSTAPDSATVTQRKASAASVGVMAERPMSSMTLSAVQKPIRTSSSASPPPTTPEPHRPPSAPAGPSGLLQHQLGSGSSGSSPTPSAESSSAAAEEKPVVMTTSMLQRHAKTSRAGGGLQSADDSDVPSSRGAGGAAKKHAAPEENPCHCTFLKVRFTHV